jgi:hypothetical protein
MSIPSAPALRGVFAVDDATFFSLVMMVVLGTMLRALLVVLN